MRRASGDLTGTQTTSYNILPCILKEIHPFFFKDLAKIPVIGIAHFMHYIENSLFHTAAQLSLHSISGYIPICVN